jgi:hypothetical protein
MCGCPDSVETEKVETYFPLFLRNHPLKQRKKSRSTHLNIRYQGSGGASSGEGGASVSQYSDARVGPSEFAGCHHHRR